MFNNRALTESIIFVQQYKFILRNIICQITAHTVYVHVCIVLMYLVCLLLPALGAPCCLRPVGPTSAHCWWETCNPLQHTSLIFHPLTTLHFFLYLLHMPSLFPFVPALIFLAMSLICLSILLLPSPMSSWGKGRGRDKEHILS